jgi:hypothetical protein
MNRTTQIRLERLEEAHMLSATPHRVLSSCPLPDEPANQAVILEWIEEGLAHVCARSATKPRIIFLSPSAPAQRLQDNR